MFLVERSLCKRSNPHIFCSCVNVICLYVCLSVCFLSHVISDWFSSSTIDHQYYWKAPETIKFVTMVLADSCRNSIILNWFWLNIISFEFNVGRFNLNWFPYILILVWLMSINFVIKLFNSITYIKSCRLYYITIEFVLRL